MDIFYLPELQLYWIFVAFILGSIIGSFLNVVIYRLHTKKTLGGKSHCMSCGAQLRWYELLPIISYVVQIARCRSCKSHIAFQYTLVELTTAVFFSWLWILFSQNIIIFGLEALIFSIILIIVVYDIRHTIIPNESVVFLSVAALILVGYESIIGTLNGSFLSHIYSGIGAVAFFGALWHVSKGRWIGLGDAKLAFPLGVLVGFPLVFSMVVFSFWVGAIIMLMVLGLQKILSKWKTKLSFITETFTMKSEVPFAPFLVLGYILTHLYSLNVFDITLFLFFL